MTSAHQARILTLAQEGLELCAEPFAALAQRTGVTVDAVLATLERAAGRGWSARSVPSSTAGL